MNYIDAWVTNVIGSPEYKYDKWWVLVEYIDEGGKGTTSLMFDTEEKALSIKKDYKFLH